MDLQTGFTCTVPYMHMGIYLGGLPEFVDCVEDDFNTQGNCSDLLICLNADSEWINVIYDKIPERYVLQQPNVTSMFVAFVHGDCNVFPGPNTGVNEWFLSFFGYQGPFQPGKIPFDKDGFTMATRDDDPEWSDFVNIMLMGLFAAVLANITQNRATEMLSANVFGEELEHAVSAARCGNGTQPHLHEPCNYYSCTSRARKKPSCTRRATKIVTCTRRATITKHD